MTQLSLSIASDELVSFGRLEEHFDLLIVTQISKGDEEHGFVKTERHLFIEKETFFEELESAFRHDLRVFDSFSSIDGHHLLARQMDGRRIEAKNRIILDNLLSFEESLKILAVFVYKVGQLLLVECSFLSFGLKHSILV